MARPVVRRLARLTDRQWLLIGAAIVAATVLLAFALAIVALTRSGEAHTVTGPVNGRHAGRFELAGGVGAITVHAADLGGDLYRITTPRTAAVPRVARQGDTVSLRLAGGGSSTGPASTVDVVLNDSVRWGLRLAAGTRDATLDLTGATVSTVEFAAGVSRIDLTLPGPSGTVPVRVAGGADQFTAHLPGATAARVRVGAGAGNATLDGERHSGVAAGTVFTLGTFDTAADRYDIDLASGVANVVVERG